MRSSEGIAGLTVSCGDSDALAALRNACDGLAKADVKALGEARHDGPVAPHHHAVRAPKAAVLLILVPVRQRDLQRGAQSATGGRVGADVQSCWMSAARTAAQPQAATQGGPHVLILAVSWLMCGRDIL